jgi:hypothetical protein
MSANKYNVIERQHTGTAAKPGTVRHVHVSGPHKWETAWRKAALLNREAVRKWKREGLSVHDAPFFTTEEVR